MKSCSVADCPNKYYAKGWCEKHYQRVAKYGSPEGNPTRTHASFEDRFWRRVDKTGECWLWLGAKIKTGYGRVQMGGKGSRYDGARRVSFEMANGFMPVVVMHKCDNPSCVRPDHLQAGTHKENTADMIRKDRHKRKGPQGEAHPKAKLTEQQVREIRTREGQSAASVGREYGVNHKAILSIWRGTHWKHIT